MPAMSTSSTPMMNTTDASTAFGHVLQRLGEEQQHDEHDDRGREHRDLRLAAGAVDHLRLGRAAVHDERARQNRRPRWRAPRPTRSTFSSNGSSYFAAYARDVAALWARITTNIATAVPTSGQTWRPRHVGDAEGGQAARDRAERRHAVRGEVPVPAHEDRADDRDERARDLRRDHAARRRSPR